VCGIADHTLLLALALRNEGVEVGFISKQGSGRGLPSGPVDHWDGSAGGLAECVRRQQPDWVWVQLSGYGYSRWGAPVALARAVRALRHNLPTIAVAVCVHETHCQPHQLGRKGRLLSPWQRRTVGVVVRQADILFTSIPKYVRMVTEDYGFPSDRVVRLPIGSNIAVTPLSAGERAQIRQRFGWQPHEVIAVTFGSTASQIRALKNCGDCLARGIASGQLHRVVCLGGQPGQQHIDLMSLPKVLRRPEIVTLLGYQRDEQVAEILGCGDFAFSAYPQTLLGKSTSFSSYAMAGLPVLVSGSRINEVEDPKLPPFLFTENWDWNCSGRARELQELREGIRAYATENLGWSVIAGKVLRVLSSLVAVGCHVMRPPGHALTLSEN
jgi:hypothetical protein